mgnify:CR=1 FL=1
MKKILTVAIACACLTGFSACNDFLEEKPKSSLTAPDYYQTEAQAQANVNYLYRTGASSKLTGAGSAYVGPFASITGQLTGYFTNSYEGQELTCKYSRELTRQQNIRQLTETQTKAKTEIERLEKEVANCLKQLTEQETALKVTQRLYENARMAVGKDVKALRRQLQEGEACPVCGSTTHPYHREQEVVDTLYRNMEQEYNTAVSAYQQINNRSIVLQRDLTHQRATEVQIKEQLFVLQQEGLPAGEEEHIQNRLNELAERISAYQHLYAEWQQNDEKIKKLRTYCDALRENVSQCRLAAQKVSAAKEQSAILQKAAVDEQQRFEVIAKALDALRQERSLLLKGKSADEAEAAVARREKELNEALEKARKQVEGVQNHLSGLQGEMKQLSVVIEELREQQKGIELPDQLPQTIAKQQEDNLNTERTLSTAEARLLQQAKNKTIFEQITKELTEKQYGSPSALIDS